ncbi:HAD family hydrolase [Amphritea opalescens]|uniref:HAD family hydrolase n=1 Tax=Amphritea opalescens TaxID=2490544 RepID=A0A430KUN1_9GAMM|nr:HAD-IA family hydrolase [Amphritea opalescens]RTE67168.1 HAD family hydrolase [Amphritea opalescens]
MIKCITFDLDDTLWAVDPVIVEANKTLYQWLAEHAELFVNCYQLSDFDQLKNRALEAFPDIGHSVTLIRLKQLEIGLLDAGYSAEQAVALSHQAFEVFIAARNQVELFEHARSMLEQLKAEGYVIGALSNGNADVNRVGLGDVFDFALNADGVGKEKPHPLMFEQMLHQQQLRPEQVIHIGDNPHHDIVGAKNVGLWAIWVNLKQGVWPEVAPADQTVTCLSEIPERVAQIAAASHHRATL